MKSIYLCTGLFSVFCHQLALGQYSGPADTEHGIDPAIPSGSPLITGWAASVESLYQTPSGSGSGDAALGQYNTSLVSLGDLSESEINSGDPVGEITLSFEGGFRDVSGWDFTVFENGFASGSSDLFAEFAYVEVSSDGTHFARFDSISTNTDASISYGAGFEYFDVTNVYNLAGKHSGGFGTPFDLNELIDDPLVIDGTLDLDQISFVRLVDIPGDGSFLDSEGNGIIDNWPTSGTGGFDLRAVGYRTAAVPEPSTVALALGLMTFGFVYIRRRSMRKT